MIGWLTSEFQLMTYPPSQQNLLAATDTGLWQRADRSQASRNAKSTVLQIQPDTKSVAWSHYIVTTVASYGPWRQLCTTCQTSAGGPQPVQANACVAQKQLTAVTTSQGGCI